MVVEHRRLRTVGSSAPATLCRLRMPTQRNDKMKNSTTTDLTTAAVAQNTPESVQTQRDRRELLALLGGALGALTLTACAEGQGDAGQIESLVQGISGSTTVMYADVITDLRALAGSTTTVAVLKGASAIFDGGGGVFIWSTTAAQDDGWAIVNASSGNAAGWRRVAASIGSVANITALRATAGTPGALAVLRGYAAAGDGGGGLFTWSTVSAPDDGGTIFNAASGNSSGWRRIFSGGFDVKWFGAKGDNATADDAAIQRAINAAYSADVYLSQNTGRTVLLSAGIYQLASPLIIANNFVANASNGLILEGEGWHSVLVPRSGVAAAIIVTFGYGALRDFSINGAAKAGGSAAGIVFKRGVATQVTNVYISSCAGDGMLFDNHYPFTPSFVGNNDTMTVSSCVITNCGGYGIQLKGGPDNNNITFRTCTVQNNTHAGLLIRGNLNRVEGGDWSYNGGPAGIVLSDAADSSISVGNVLLYPYTDAMANTVYNSGKSQQNTILLGYGQGGGANPTWSGVANSAQNDMVIAPDLANTQGAGLAIVTSNSNPSRGLKITAAPGLPLTQLYAEGDANQALWVYSKGSGGIALGYHADPFQAQFCKTLALSLTVPAGGTASFVGTVSNNNSPVSVKLGDIAHASFGSILPAGVYIRSVEVTAAATVTVTFQNSSATAQVLNNYVRIQVTVY